MPRPTTGTVRPRYAATNNPASVSPLAPAGAIDTAVVMREVRFEVADFGTAASLVRNGLGVAFLPESFAVSLPELPTIRVAGAHLSWPVSVATTARRPLSRAGRAFLTELLAAAPGPAP